MEILAKLKDQGWYLSNDGIKKLPDDVDKSDVKKVIQAAMDMDFREIGGGALPTDFSKKVETIPGRIVLQISKIRNIAAPKVDEESRYAPRFFQLELTDGLNQIQALEIESISSLNFNTPPGTKIYLKSEKIPLMQGMLMLKPNDIQLLGGKVSNLFEKWETNRTLLKYAKGGKLINGGTSGPPPWTAFGQKIQQQNVSVVNDKNFKSLAAANEKEGKENNEFDTMRNEAIAEAAKTGSKKIFGGGNQQIVDHNVKKILEKGYTEDEAKNALRATRNNLEKALYNLKRRDEFKNKDDIKNTSYDKNKGTATYDKNSASVVKRGPNSNIRESYSSKKGGKDDLVTTGKPAGNVSLFDFLTDKLPTNPTETEKPSSSSSQGQQQFGLSSASNQHQGQQSSKYETKSERPSRQSDSYNSSNSKASYYNNINNSNFQQQSSSSFVDTRNQNNQQNQHYIPNSQNNKNSSNQKFENNLSSSFQANRNYSQDSERPRNRNNRESTERSGTGSLNMAGSNRNYQNSYQGKSSASDRQYDEQNSSDRYYNSQNQRNYNYSQRNSKSQQGNDRESGGRSGGNDRSNYQNSNTSHYQYQQHQNNNNNYDNNRTPRNDNQSYRNGYENARSGASYQNNKGNQSQMPSRHSQKDITTNSYPQSQTSNNSRNYSDNRQQSYHQQQSNQNSESKLNKIIEDTSKLKIDQASQQQVQQTHNQKLRTSQNSTSHRNQNVNYQHQQQIVSQHQPQIMTVVSHQGPPQNQSQIQQHTGQHNQQQPQTHPHFQQPPQVHGPHPLQTGAFTPIPNGFTYDPNKIMGFQNKETNEFAMTMLKSQGIPTALTQANTMVPSQPQHPHPSVTPTIAPQSSTPHPGASAYQTMQIGHPPPPAISQHSFSPAGPAFIMQPSSIAPPPQLATIGPQVTHPHTSNLGPPQSVSGPPFSMNHGEGWNWKIGDLCLAKYWDDGRYYEAEITGISDKTCVVFYLGYGNHEEVLKSDCLPITDSQNRVINFGASQAATVVTIQQQQQPQHTAIQLTGASRGGLPNRYRSDRQMYVPPPKRDG